MFQNLPKWVAIVTGTGLSAVAAVLLAAAFAGRPSRALVPLLFVVVLLVLAYRYGAGVGLLGSAVAAVIFTLFLFPPVGQFRIENEAARANLGWMLLAGIAVPTLLLPPPQTPSKK